METPQQVAVIIRVEEHPATFAFISHRGEENVWYLPIGKVENDETKLAAANRTLREETGLRLPNGVALKEYDSFVNTQNGQPISVVTVFAADVPFSYLDADNYRSRSVARAMAQDLLSTTSIEHVGSLISGSLQ